MVYLIEAKSHRTATQEVKSEINRLQDLRIELEVSWLPGHANIKGNELADQQAKEAAHFQVLGGGGLLVTCLSITDHL